MPLVASLKTAGDTLRNMMELSNWFLLLPTNLTLFLQSEKGKRWVSHEIGTWGKPYSQKVQTHQDNGANFWGAN